MSPKILNYCFQVNLGRIWPDNIIWHSTLPIKALFEIWCRCLMQNMSLINMTCANHPIFCWRPKQRSGFYPPKIKIIIMAASTSLTFMDSSILDIKHSPGIDGTGWIPSDPPGGTGCEFLSVCAQVKPPPCCCCCCFELLFFWLRRRPLSGLRVAPDGLHGLNLLEASGQLGLAGLQQRRRPCGVPSQDLRHHLHPLVHDHLKRQGRGPFSHT